MTVEDLLLNIARTVGQEVVQGCHSWPPDFEVEFLQEVKKEGQIVTTFQKHLRKSFTYACEILLLLLRDDFFFKLFGIEDVGQGFQNITEIAILDKNKTL